MTATSRGGLLGGALLLFALGGAPARAAQATGAPLPMPSMEERTAAFGEIDLAVKAGEHGKAADLLLALAQDPAQAVFQAEAWARLGASLEKLGQPYAALHAYARALETDAVMVSSVAKPALDLADSLGDAALLEPVFGKNVGIEVDPATRGRVAYLAARDAHEQGNYGTAVAFLKMVPSEAPVYAEAKALEGVVLSHTGRYTDAVAALQIALAAGSARSDADRWANVMHLNIGRAYFGAGEFVRAIEYFAKIDRDSPYWAEAQFERAWAHFRLDDLNGTLGLLYTHSSPFFTGEYFPEAALLEIYSLFLLCKFPAAGTGIDQFAVRFGDMLEQLRKAGAGSPEQLFAQMQQSIAVESGEARKEEAELPLMVVRPFRDEDRFARAVQSVRRLDQDLAALGSAQGQWVGTARDWLGSRRAAIIAEEGGRIQNQVRLMEDELATMLGNAEMNKLDILQMESRMYERASVTGVMEKAKRTVDREIRVKAGYRWWPYEGEYWADELGWYRIDTKPECPESMRATPPTE